MKKPNSGGTIGNGPLYPDLGGCGPDWPVHPKRLLAYIDWEAYCENLKKPSVVADKGKHELP